MTLQREIENLLGTVEHFDYWESALALGTLMNQDPGQKMTCQQLIAKIRDYQGEIALKSQDPVLVVMGTSGWRDRIGKGFSLANVRRTVQAIITTLKSDFFLSYNGNRDFDEIRKKGVVVFRDNRFLGREFEQAAIEELTAQKIKVFCAGECPTGVGSALLTSLKAAASINFTPSHNPMDYQGLKFNPADGGPAPQEVTTIIEKEANALMLKPVSDNSHAIDLSLVTGIDPKKIYLEYLLERKNFDLEKIRLWIGQKVSDLMLIIDYMHGSARGFVEAILGEQLVAQLQKANSFLLLNTDDDYSFHGVKPEPSAVNQAPLIDLLKKSGRKYTLAVAMDPDADRIRFGDAQMDIDMNRFGAIAYQICLNKNPKAGIVSTAPSSDLALEIAKQNGVDFFETAVGFKYFRPFLASKRVEVAFEESDGISFGGHTLEKDALIGFIAAIDSMVQTGQNISEQYQGLCERYGYFYPFKEGVELKGITVEQWQEYKNAVVNVLKNELFAEGDSLTIGKQQVDIAKIQTVDGLKLIFADRSWILLRPSGTEPKFRIYLEVVSKDRMSDIESRLESYLECGNRILDEARKKVVKN